MPPRPAPDLDLRREQVVRTARSIAESEGWQAVTMRRLAGDLGVTQPVLYSALAGRQAIIDAAALGGFGELADALEAEDRSPLPRMRCYLTFAAAHPGTYEAMFSLPSGLPFAVEHTPEPLLRAFGAVRDAFDDADETRAEVAWATLHGLATLQASGRLPAHQEQARLDLAVRILTDPAA